MPGPAPRDVPVVMLPHRGRMRPYEVQTQSLPQGQWLCWLGLHLPRTRKCAQTYSVLVSRSRTGCWRCSCDVPRCCHQAYGQWLYHVQTETVSQPLPVCQERK